jgi:hypothetical protein
VSLGAHKRAPFVFWKSVMTRICHQSATSLPSHKVLVRLVAMIAADEKDTTTKVALSKGLTAVIDDVSLILVKNAR